MPLRAIAGVVGHGHAFEAHIGFHRQYIGVLRQTTYRSVQRHALQRRVQAHQVVLGVDLAVALQTQARIARHGGDALTVALEKLFPVERLAVGSLGEVAGAGRVCLQLDDQALYGRGV